MSEQEIKWTNLHPVLCAPPTQAELDAERRRALRWWFSACGVVAAIELCVLSRVLWGQTSSVLGGFVMFLLVVFAIPILSDASPWSTNTARSPMAADDLPVLRDVFARDALDAESVEQYRQQVAALGRPLVRRDLRLIAEHRQAVRTWIAQEASARDLAAFSEPGEMSREAGGA